MSVAGSQGSPVRMPASTDLSASTVSAYTSRSAYGVLSGTSARRSPVAGLMGVLLIVLFPWRVRTG